MFEHKKFYDYAYELYNSVGANSINTYAPTNQYPLYKHYYDESHHAKTQASSSSFSKTKKIPTKDNKNIEKNQNSIRQIESSYINNPNPKDKRTREEMAGSSQGRRASSAKPKKDSKRERKHQ